MNEQQHQLLVDKYAPKTPRDIIGNQANLQMIMSWLQNWRSNRTTQRGILMQGPPGSGKTSTVKVVCAALGINVIECNASDTRKASSIEDLMDPYLPQKQGAEATSATAGGGTKTKRPTAKKRKTTKASAAASAKSADSGDSEEEDTPPPKVFTQSSMRSFFIKTTPNNVKPVANASSQVVAPLTVLMMDEIDGVDGTSDRGGMSTLCQMIAKATIPIICIGNDCSNPQKFGTLKSLCLPINWQRPQPEHIMARMLTITRAENMSVDPRVLQGFITSQHGDIRQILNELQFWFATQRQTPTLAKNQVLPLENFGIQVAAADALVVRVDSNAGLARVQKDVVVQMFDLAREVFFHRKPSESSDAIEERTQAYFADSHIVPLLIQENYLNGTGAGALSLDDMVAAADSISLADTVDRCIQADQLYELSPAHAFFSTVVPGHLAQNVPIAPGKQINFPTLLGKMSTSTKNRNTTVQVRNALMRTDGLTNTRDVGLELIPTLRDTCLALADPKTSSTPSMHADHLRPSTRWLTSRQHASPTLTLHTLQHDSCKLSIDAAQMQILQHAVSTETLPVEAHTLLQAIRARNAAAVPGTPVTTLMPHAAFLFHLQGKARSSATWRDLLCCPAAEPVAVAATAAPPVAQAPAKKKTKAALAKAAAASGQAMPFDGLDVVAAFAAQCDIKKPLLDSVLTWMESLVLDPTQCYSARVPTAQKAALTRAFTKAVEAITSQHKVRAKRKADEMLLEAAARPASEVTTLQTGDGSDVPADDEAYADALATGINDDGMDDVGRQFAD